MRCWGLSLILALMWAVPAAQAADGTFLGKVAEPPVSQTAVPGWIFIQGRNHLLRRVEVAHAEILFGEDIPVSQRRKCNADCLTPGQEVRVTAHQDSNGEWLAKQVEILKIAPKVADTQLTAELSSGNPSIFPLFR